MDTLALTEVDMDSSASDLLRSEELLAKMKEMLGALNSYEAEMPRRKRKHIHNEEDMKKKVPFAKKALDSAFEHQDLVSPEFLEKFWENYASFLTMKDLYEKAGKLQDQLEKLCPEAAIPHSTDSTKTNG